jgi:hypothetical protein
MLGTRRNAPLSPDKNSLARHVSRSMIAWVNSLSYVS